jgi:hypothetical protein
MLFYATSLSHTVGPSFQPPNVALLAQHWLDSSSKPVLSLDRLRLADLMSTSEGDVRQSIRIILDSELARLPDDQLISLAEQWQNKCELVIITQPI